jgi:hypothetical protein
VGGKMNIVNWLIRDWNIKTTVRESEAEAIRTNTHERPNRTDDSRINGFNLAHTIEARHNETRPNGFIVILLWSWRLWHGLGFLFYIKRPQLPDVWARACASI